MVQRAHVERHRPSRLRPIAAALITLAFFLGLTAATWSSITDVARQDASDRFDGSADQAAEAVEREISQYYDRLRDVGTFAATPNGAAPTSFAGYVHDTRLFEQLPALAGVLYISRVPDADLPAFLDAQRASDPGFDVFEIAPPEGDVRYLLTAYAPGRVDLDLPIGTDVSALETVTTLVTSSADTGNAIAGSFQEDPYLQQVADQNSFPMVDALLDLDFFIGVPIYAPGTTPQGPPNVPVGWVAATIADFEEVAVDASGAVPDDLGVELTVELDGTGLGSRSDISRVAQIDSGAGPRESAAFESHRGVTVAGVDWTLDVWSRSDADALPASSRIALAAGVAGSALAAGLVYVRLRSRQRERAYASDTAQRELFQREILDSVANPMVVVDRSGAIVRANPAWAELWSDADLGGAHPGLSSWVGASYAELVGRVALSGDPELVAATEAVLDGSETIDVEVALELDERADRTGPDPRARRDEVVAGPDSRASSATNPEPDPAWFAVRVTPLRGQRPGAILIHTDITDAKRSQDELAAQATRDPLTGLANRTTFDEQLERALVPTRTTDRRIAVLFIDLDGFKPVNDTYGHAVGDDVLRTVARRIQAVVRATDTAARLGGDEFVVLVDPVGDRSIAEATAERILAAMATPIRSQDHEVHLAASIGVAVVEGPADTTAAALIERADAAMYESKQRGGSRTTIIVG